MASITSNQLSVQGYALTFAGIPFVSDVARLVRMTQPTPEGEVADQQPLRKQQPFADLIDELNRSLPWHLLQDVSPLSDFPGRNASALARWANAPDFPSEDVKIGEWYYPNGASRWGMFRGLATSSMVKSMLDATGGVSAATFRMKAAPTVNPTSSADDFDLQTEMFMLPARPLAEHGGGYDGLWLVTLVDERWNWQGFPASLPITFKSTWAELVDSIAVEMGISISYSAFPAAYSQPEPDSQLWTALENAPLLLDAICLNTGRTFVRNLEGGGRIIRVGARQPQYFRQSVPARGRGHFSVRRN